MLHTTYSLAVKAGACHHELSKVVDALGGVESYGADTPVPLSAVLEHTSLDSAIWALRCVLPGQEEERDRIAHFFACACAEQALPIFEATREEMAATRAAAGDAARVAASAARAARAARVEARANSWAAAGDAAWAARPAVGDAAWAAARDAQKASFLRLLDEPVPSPVP